MHTLLLFLMVTCPSGLEHDLSGWDIYSPGSFDVSDSGVICYGDRDNTRLVFINEQGKLIRFAGRKGEGPGEFASISKISWEHSEKLFLVYDWSGRLSMWRDDGSLVQESKVAPKLRQFIALENKTVAYVADDFGQPGSKPSLNLLSLKSGEISNLWQRAPLTQANGFHRQEEPAFIFKLDWNHRLLTDSNAKRYALCYNDQATVYVFSRKNHQQVQRLEVELPTCSVTEAMFQEAFKRKFSNNLARTIAPFVHWTPDQYWPTVQGLKLDDLDRIWVFSKTEQGYPYKVYDTSGKHVFSGKSVVHPERIRVRRDQMYFTVETNDHLLLKREPVFQLMDH